MPVKNQTFTAGQRMLKQDYEVSRYRDTYLNEVALHYHDFYEIYLFLSGDVTYTIESRSYHLSPGDVLIISPMELHQPVFSEERQIYERIVVRIGKAYLQQFCESGHDLTACFDTSVPWHTNFLRLDGGNRQLLTYILEQMRQESQSDLFASELAVQAYLVQALVLINRIVQQIPWSREQGDRSGSLVTNVLTYINDHYHEDLSLDLLANRFFISKYHLSREFNRLVGTSVYRYIVHKRLVIARQLMCEGVPSTTVYQQCGFGDYSNFYRAFKSEYRMSPRQFVSELKEDALRAQGLNQERNGILRDPEQQ